MGNKWISNEFETLFFCVNCVNEKLNKSDQISNVFYFFSV